MSARRLNAVKCPLCGSLLETDVSVGASLRCPSCTGSFVLGDEHVRRRGGDLNRWAYRLLIPLGYLAFVGIPVGGIAYYVSTREDAKREDAAPEARVRPPTDTPRPDTTPRPAPPRKKTRKNLTPADEPRDPVPEPVVPSVPKTTPEPAPGVPAPPEPAAAVAVAPGPREAPPPVEVAPDPHEIYWKLETNGFVSKWETVGVVDVRVALVTVTHYPILDPTRETVTDSKTPALVVVIEARLNDPNRNRLLLSWTSGSTHYKSVFLEGGTRQLAPRELPPGRRLNTGLAYPAALPKDGSAVRDVLLFEVPPEGTRELELRLEAERVRENGNFWLKIPAAAWKK